MTSLCSTANGVTLDDRIRASPASTVRPFVRIASSSEMSLLHLPRALRTEHSPTWRLWFHFAVDTFYANFHASLI